jgi:hypothetical protein
MGLEGATVVAYLSSEGFAELAGLLGLQERDEGLTATITSTDAFGVWLSPAGDEWARVVGAPWRYFRALQLEFQAEPEASPEIRRQIGFQRQRT